MHQFRYRKGSLFCEDVSIEALVRKYGTPLYVYSEGTLTDHYKRLSGALGSMDHLVCFAAKANSNLAVLRALSNLGAGFDIVSAGELKRVIAAGGDPAKCVFAGVGKTEEEITLALRQGIYAFNVESEPELARIDSIAGRLRKVAPVAVRVNPNVDAHTHAKITTGTYENKFGIAYEEVEDVYARASKRRNLRLRGIQMHIGSQLTEVRPFAEAVRKVVPLASRLAAKYQLEFLSVGGGLGIVYQPALASGSPGWWQSPEAQDVLTPTRYAEAVAPSLKEFGRRILIEPGRFIVGNAGVLVTRVEYVKQTGQKNFVIVDAAMNDLIRPAFYDSYHEIIPLRRKAGAKVLSDVVGPICESSDVFCKDRPLPKVGEGDYMVLLSTGAYGSVMGSNYNSRALPAEVMVRGSRSALVRARQKLSDIWALEKVPPWL